MSDQVAVPDALFALLSNDAELGELLSAPDAVFPDFAPEGAEYPYVLYSPLSGALTWAFRSASHEQSWLVRGVSRSDPDRAAAIDTRCEELLNDAPLELPGRHLLYVRREHDVPNSEIDDGELVVHRGGLYSIITEAAR